MTKPSTAPSRQPENAAAYMRKWRAANLDRARAISRRADLKRSRPAEYRANRAAAYARQNAPLVYVWIAPDGQADYVGRGGRRRAITHGIGITRADWWTPEHTLLTEACDSEWQAMEMEGRWGAFFQPRHNVEGYRHTQ